jgi:hypothetical protein
VRNLKATPLCLDAYFPVGMRSSKPNYKKANAPKIFLFGGSAKGRSHIAYNIKGYQEGATLTMLCGEIE